MSKGKSSNSECCNPNGFGELPTPNEEGSGTIYTPAEATLDGSLSDGLLREEDEEGSVDFPLFPFLSGSSSAAEEEEPGLLFPPLSVNNQEEDSDTNNIHVCIYIYIHVVLFES